MATYDLADVSLVGVIVRTRVRQFEERHPGCPVYAADAGGSPATRPGDLPLTRGCLSIPDPWIPLGGRKLYIAINELMNRSEAALVQRSGEL